MAESGSIYTLVEEVNSMDQWVTPLTHYFHDIINVACNIIIATKNSFNSTSVAVGKTEDFNTIMKFSYSAEILEG